MTLNELGRVISSTGLAEIDEAVPLDCPRECLGLSCLKDEYQCLCQLGASETSVVRENGKPVAVTIVVKVPPSGGLDATGAILSNIKLMGLLADARVTNREVHSTFKLNRPENYQIKAFLCDED